MNTPRWLSPVRSSVERGAVGRAAVAQVVQHDAGGAERARTSSRPGAGGSAGRRPRPAWRSARLPCTISRPLREPLAPVGLDEQAALRRRGSSGSTIQTPAIVSLGLGHALAMAGSLHVDLAVVADHQAQRPGPGCERVTTASRPMRQSSSRGMSMTVLPVHHDGVLDLASSTISQPSPIAVNGPMKLSATGRRRRSRPGRGSSSDGSSRRPRRRRGRRASSPRRRRRRCAVSIFSSSSRLASSSGVSLPVSIHQPVEQLGADAVALVDQPLDGVGDLQLAAGRRLRSPARRRGSCRSNR